MSSTILVLHEYGARSHYAAAELAAERAGYQIQYKEFAILRNMARSIRRRDAHMFFRQFSNLWFMLTLVWPGRRYDGHAIILGIAPFDFRVIFLLRFILRNKIYIHTSWPYWDGSRQPKNPLPGIIPLWKILMRHCRQVFIVTEYGCNNLKKSKFGHCAATIVGHSYNGDHYFPANTLPTQQTINIGYAGRLEASKGVDLIVSMAKKHANKPWIFKIAGDGTLRNVVSSATKKGNIEYLGFLRSPAEMGTFYRELDILLLPSKRCEDWEELFGLVLIEAMACGVIPITTQHPGPTEILRHHDPRTLMPEETFLEDAPIFIQEISTNPTLRNELRALSVDIAKKYNINSVAKIWSTLFEKEE